VKSRLPGDCAVEIESIIRFTSLHGRARGGRSVMRTRGARTQAAKSRRSLPVLRRKRKKDLRDVQDLATVRLDMCSACCLMNTSMSETVILFTDLRLFRSSDIKVRTSSKSRRSVASATPRWRRRNSQYSLRRGDMGAGARFGLHSGRAAPRARIAYAHAWSAFLAIRQLLALTGPLVLGPTYERANRDAPSRVSSATSSRPSRSQ
jgi:hypothetical protein